MNEVTHERWFAAQVAESQFWEGVNVKQLLRICADQPAFLDLIGQSDLPNLFDNQEILEIGVGPLAISLTSFYADKHKIKRLLKLEPLPRRLIPESSAMRDTWAMGFLEWVHSLSEEGEYVQIPAEKMNYNQEFDTVITYNVLDHVQDPLGILKNAYNALRKGGKVLVGVDCRSLLGRIKFEYILRRTRKGEILVEAHPHTFLTHHVVQMLNDAGFQDVRVMGIPGLFRRFAGTTFRPAFIASKIL
jgi:SAM-dependent methyltransferase